MSQQFWRQTLTAAQLCLSNSRVELKPLTLDHLEGLSKIAYNPSIWEHNPHVNVDTEAKLITYIETALKMKEAFTRVPFVVLDKQTNKIAGTTSFYAISEQDRKLAIGYTWFGKEFQKTGLNPAVKSAQHEYTFNILKTIRVEYHTDSKNQASRRSIQSNGCTFEGIFRNHMIKHNGVYRDTATFSITDTEYFQQRDKLLVV